MNTGPEDLLDEDDVRRLRRSGVLVPCPRWTDTPTRPEVLEQLRENVRRSYGRKPKREDER